MSVGKATRKLSCWILVTFRRHLAAWVCRRKVSTWNKGNRVEEKRAAQKEVEMNIKTIDSLDVDAQRILLSFSRVE